MREGERERLEDAEKSGREGELVEGAVLSAAGLSREDSDVLTHQQAVSSFNRRGRQRSSSCAHPLLLGAHSVAGSGETEETWLLSAAQHPAT